MTHISIREQAAADGNALLVFDGGEQYPITISDPFSEAEEARLEWYFEEHLRFPFTGQVRAREAAASIPVYGEALFQQVFADPDAYARYKAALQSGVERLAFEVAGSPDLRAALGCAARPAPAPTADPASADGAPQPHPPDRSRRAARIARRK